MYYTLLPNLYRVLHITPLNLKSNNMPFIYIYIFITVGIRISLRVPRLIPWDPEVNDQVNPPMALRGLKLVTIKEQT